MKRLNWKLILASLATLALGSSAKAQILYQATAAVWEPLPGATYHVYGHPDVLVYGESGHHAGLTRAPNSTTVIDRTFEVNVAGGVFNDRFQGPVLTPNGTWSEDDDLWVAKGLAKGTYQASSVTTIGGISSTPNSRNFYVVSLPTCKQSGSHLPLNVCPTD